MTTTQTETETILMAAAIALQNEATASQNVADSIKAQSIANPSDKDLTTSVITSQEEATKDQLAADQALIKAMEAETQPAVILEIAEPIVIAQTVIQPSPTTPVVVITEPTVAPTAIKKTVSKSGSVTNVSTPTIVSGSFTDTVAKIKVSGTVAQRSLVAQLEQYLTSMKPGMPVEASTGSRNQTSLWRTIQNVIDRSGDEFTSLYSLLLAYFEAYKDDAFHERYVFRFAENITMPADELATYQQMINLIKLTASQKGRDVALRQVDLGRTMKSNISEAGRQRVLGFYNR
jgi:hypothetical protein